MLPTLRILKGEAPQTIELSEAEIVIGRQPECGLHLTANTVSGTHARLQRRNGNYFVEDLHSRNGTFVNDEPIRGAVPLHHNDRLRLGHVVMMYEEPQPARPTSPLAIAEGDSSSLFPVDVQHEDDSATITGSVGSGTRFGLLETHPQKKLEAVLKISTSLTGTVDLPSLLPRILDELFDIFPSADRGCVLIKDASGELVPRAMKYKRETQHDSMRISRTILEKVIREKSGFLSADASQEFSSVESIAGLQIRSMMCVPMLGLDNHVLGVLNIDSQSPVGQFSQLDLELMMAVAGMAANAYENTRLLASYVEKEKQDNELSIARDIQRALLPESLPEAKGYEFFASYDSAQAVGGDYYDAFDLGEGRLCFAFGDVAGKGVPGALIMSRLSSCVQSTMSFCRQADEAVLAINEHMCDSSVEGRFVTFVLIILDVNTHEMAVVNAGHMSPLIRRPDGTIHEFDDDKVGPPIGVVEGYPYEIDRRSLAPGETVVIVTDGVDEAMNAAQEIYGKPRTLDFICQCPLPARELGQALLADVRRHAAGYPQSDDITIMTLGRNSA